MKNYLIPPETKSYGSNGEQMYWYIIAKSLYLKGDGCVDDFSKVGYSCEIDTIFIEDDVLIHEDAFWNCNVENLCYLVMPSKCSERIVLEDQEYGFSLSEIFEDFPNLMILEKSKEIKIVYASPNLVDVVIPNGVTVIGDGCFSPWPGSVESQLASVLISDSVKVIGDEAFSRCSKLKRIIIPGSVNKIGNGAFSYCTSLKEVIINEGLSRLGQNAFCGCTELTSVIIPDTVTDIGYQAFCDCSALKTMCLPSNLSTIEGYVFFYSGIENLYIPEGVKSIEPMAFCGVENIEYHGSVPNGPYYEEEYTYWNWGARKINGISCKNIKLLDYTEHPDGTRTNRYINYDIMQESTCIYDAQWNLLKGVEW